MNITKRQLQRIIKEEKQKLMNEYVHLSDPKLVKFQRELDAAYFNAIQDGADPRDLSQIAKSFLAGMG